LHRGTQFAAAAAVAPRSHDVVGGIQRLLADHSSVDRESVRVRFVRLGQYSLDIEISAYILVADWGRFLEVQEHLLFAIADIVAAAGAELAFPSQTMYLSDPKAALRPPSMRT
jgi:MscS family membrane protein